MRFERTHTTPPFHTHRLPWRVTQWQRLCIHCALDAIAGLYGQATSVLHIVKLLKFIEKFLTEKWIQFL